MRSIESLRCTVDAVYNITQQSCSDARGPFSSLFAGFQDFARPLIDLKREIREEFRLKLHSSLLRLARASLARRRSRRATRISPLPPLSLSLFPIRSTKSAALSGFRRRSKRMSQLPRALLFPRLASVGRLRLLHTTTSVKSGGGDVWWGPEKAAGREVVGYGPRGDPGVRFFLFIAFLCSFLIF